MIKIPKIILLTGVNGFLGNYLTPVLLKEGFIIHGIGKGNCRLEIKHPHFYYHSIDITQKDCLYNLLETIQPSIIIHASAISQPDECERDKTNAFNNNVFSTISLLSFAAKIKAYFIFISTDFVFDGIKGLYKEDDLPHPINYYGNTKLWSENFVLQYEYDFAIVRTVLVFGKPLKGRSNIISTILQKLKTKQSITLIQDQFRTPTYIEDLVWGILTIITKNKTGIWHIGGEERLLSPYQMGLLIAEKFQLDTSLLIPVNNKNFIESAKRPAITGLNIQKAKMELNYSPTPFITGVIKMS